MDWLLHWITVTIFVVKACKLFVRSSFWKPRFVLYLYLLLLLLLESFCSPRNIAIALSPVYLEIKFIFRKLCFYLFYQRNIFPFKNLSYICGMATEEIKFHIH